MGTTARLASPAATSAPKRKRIKHSARSPSSRFWQVSLRGRGGSCRVFASSSSLNPFGRSPSSSPGSSTSYAPSPVRSFFVGAWDEEEDEDSLHLNALCYPDAILDEDQDEPPGTSVISSSSAPMWPMNCQGDDSPSAMRSGVGTEAMLLSQHSSLRRGATAAVLKAEENYRRAWKELQRAERLLNSTVHAASELNALPRSYSDQSVDIPILPSVALPLPGPAGLQRSPSEREAEESSPTVDLGFDAGVWCIEACMTEPESPSSKDGKKVGPPAVLTDALLSAEGAMTRKRAAVDSAARDLIARLQEEDLQAEVMDRHIEAMDQGAQHQVARWLVEEMEQLFVNGCGSDKAGPNGLDSSVCLAVPLNLDLAMQGYDEHAVRFLRHLPYDQVMKIKTIPPSTETKSLVAVSSAAEELERILSRPAAIPAVGEDLQIGRSLPKKRAPLELESASGNVLFPATASNSAPVVARQQGASAILRGDGEPEKRLGKGTFGKYHSKLVLLGCCVCSLAAYMVANFDLAVLAKDVAVILTAMSLALIAAQFVWKGGDSSESSEEEDSEDDAFDAMQRALPAPTRNLSSQTRPGLIRGRGPSWDQVIWLLGGFAVVLSLSTMVALACKAAQAGLQSVSTLACSYLLRILPTGAGAAAAGLLPSRSSAGLAQQVTTSLWLVLGGEILSSGVESLGSAAAWAMLLLCVAFSIASAPVCIASSTSRRVNELLALARSRSPSKATQAGLDM